MTCIKPFIKRLGEEFINAQKKNTNQLIKYSSSYDTSEQIIANNKDESSCSKHHNFNRDKYKTNKDFFSSTCESPGSTNIPEITDSINYIEKTSNRNLSR